MTIEEKNGLYAVLFDDKEVKQTQSLLASLDGDNFKEEEIIKGFLLTIQYESLKGKHSNFYLIDVFDLDSMFSKVVAEKDDEVGPISNNPMLDEGYFYFKDTSNIKNSSHD